MNVGILGGGQLGWMTILEGRKLGFNFLVLDPNPNAPASKIADRWFPPEEVESFYRQSDIITYEFEHIEEEVLSRVEDKVLPCVEALRLKKYRGEEKKFLYKHGYPVVPFRIAGSEELRKAVSEVGLPVVVKSEKLGYDGKGQYRVESFSELETVLRNHTHGESFVVEKFVDFEVEASVVGVRNAEGKIKLYPVTYNVHERGILLYNHIAEESPVWNEMKTITSQLMEELSIVGLLAVEFFITKDGKAIINEFAPRPHNTGHYTLDGAYTSQFENLIRALAGLPLGSTDLKLPACMVNVLGLSLEDIDVERILSVEGSKLYWYGKEKRERRKMGHINIVATDIERLKLKISKILESLYHREYQLS